MKSFSEIETISKRASRGAGFSWGVSEEIGKSIRLMEMFGLPGILYLTSYLNQIGNHNYQKITIISADNISNNIPYCPISVGLNFMDQVHNLEKIDKINFSNLAYPLLIVPFLSKTKRPFKSAFLKSVNSKCAKNVVSISNVNSCFPSFNPTKGRVYSFNTFIVQHLNGKFIKIFNVSGQKVC